MEGWVEEISKCVIVDILRVLLVMNEKFFKIDKIVELIVDSYDNGLGVFAEKTNLEDVVPKGVGDLEKSLFLFYVTQIDYATNSKRLNANAAKAFNQNAEFFNPNYLAGIEASALKGFLEKIGPRYVNEAVVRWQINSRNLLEKYDGDPRNIFHDTSAQIVLDKVLEFRGFGPKTGNFFFRTMVDTFNYRYSDLNEIEQPVDRHDIRLTWEWGYLETSEITDRNVCKVKKLWKDVCIRTGINWITLDKAMWLIGSKGVKTGNFVKDFNRNIGR